MSAHNHIYPGHIPGADRPELPELSITVHRPRLDRARVARPNLNFNLLAE